MQLLHKTAFNLWPGEAPGAVGEQPEDIPGLQVFFPTTQATGAAMIVCPGGGYVVLAEHEGVPVAEWLASHGITAFVLRYRLGARYRYPTPLQDAQRAIRFVRSHAADWQLDASRIGMLGFSAGGHLTSMAATHASAGDTQAGDPIERVSARPDVQILIYPVISPLFDGGAITHLWANDPHPTPELLEALSSDLRVSAQTPPAFLVHSTGDIGVPVTHSDLYATSLARAGIAYEFVRGDLGDHGFGLQDSWGPQCIAWLRQMGFVDAL